MPERIQEKVLVTGATGFLGTHLVESLAQRKAQIRALVRDQQHVSSRLANQAEILCGDLNDPLSVNAAMRDISVVFHCAAVTQNNLPWKVHFDSNVQGTENVLLAAQKTG